MSLPWLTPPARHHLNKPALEDEFPAPRYPLPGVQEYLKTPAPQDIVEDIPLDPLHPPPPAGAHGATHSGEGSHAGRLGGGGISSSVADAKKKARKFTGRCWMARDFPVSLR